MTIGIIGLGLIGGSLAKAFKEHSDFDILGMDIDESVMKSALEQGAIDGALDLEKCDMVLIALNPHDVINYARENLNSFKKNSIVIDCSGVKRSICKAISKSLFDVGVHFIGGHPMAGKAKVGFAHSSENLFKGASMILCQDALTNEEALKKAQEVLNLLGFKNMVVTNAEVHDKTIAFTSQLAHVVSNAYIRSDTARNQLGFSAGSYKDLTRVAWLNEEMWAELFLENKDNLIYEIDGLIQRLSEYSDALKNNDEKGLKEILIEGKKMKEAIID